MNDAPSTLTPVAKRDQPLRVALCGIGLEAYWEQFDGLRSQLEGYLEQLADSLDQPGIEVVRLGFVDSVGRAREAGRECRRTNADVLFLYVPTYALSGVVLPLIQRAGVPVIVLNLQPTAAIDYAAFNRLPDCRNMTGHWLAYCSACPVPEIATSSSERGSHFIRVTGVLGEEQTSREIQEWLAAARVFTLLRESRLGLLGHYYSGMLDVATDITQVSITFGCDIEILEVDELSALRFAISEEAVTARVELIRDHFDVQADCPASELARAARTSVALDQFLEVYHGKIGRGLSVEMSVRHGPVTLLSVAEDQQHGFRFLISEGTCEDGPTLVIGNTNSRYRFPMGTKAFLEQWNACGPAHHCAIGVGHLAGHLTKLASLLEIPLHQVC